MKNLQILTNNNLGNFFWEQRTGLIDSIELNQLTLNSFNCQLTKKSKYILLDFYFSKIPMKKELLMIKKIKLLTSTYSGELKLFILSPLYAGSKIGYSELDNKTIVTHNYTSSFFKILITEGKINEQIKAS